MKTELIEEIKGYSDKRLINILKQQDFYSDEEVEITKKIAIEKGLVTKTQANDMARYANNMRTRRENDSFEERKSNMAPIGIGTILIIIFVIIRIILRTIN